MTHLDLDPTFADAFQTAMANQGWQIIEKEAGQVHILGWGYRIQWQKDAHTVILHYKALQTKVDARLELSSEVLSDIQTLIKTSL